MKNIVHITALLLLILIVTGCKKTGGSPPAVQTAQCRPVKEFTTLSGNEASYEYTYSNDGKVTMIKNYYPYHVIKDSTIVGDKTTANYKAEWPYSIWVADYSNSFDLLPYKTQLAVTEGTITRTDQFTYFFFYDSKNRLCRVGEQTDLVVGDNEYDLVISYNDQDNVTALRYEFTTGPRTVTTIAATGYDDKPTPFAAIKNWPFIMHAAWDNYDPEPLFTALSKNNPLGYIMPDGFKREMSYTYNSNGFPIKRANTNISASGETYSFDETFEYECQ